MADEVLCGAATMKKRMPIKHAYASFLGVIR